MPEGHVYTGHVSVVQYIDPEGGQGYVIVTAGGMHAATMIGYLELAKVDLIKDATEDV